jgi:ribosomal-protein-alanine N-acetyltransferase
MVTPLTIELLTAELIPAAVALDQRTLGGLWTRSGYERELASPNSDLLVLLPSQPAPALISPHCIAPDSPAADFSWQPLLLGLACLWAIADEAHITLLAIDPGYQQQGLGQALLYALMIAAQQRQLQWATLEVKDSNQPALHLYRKFGFETVGRRRGYYQDTGEDALVLWHNGLQTPAFEQKLQKWRQQVGDRLHRSGWVLMLDN